MKIFFLFFITFVFTTSCSKTYQKEIVLNENWVDLLDNELSKWEIYVGVPHTTVVLEGYEKYDDVRKGTPLGLNNDPKNVMSVIKENGELVLKITGEIYAGLTSLQEFENYHFKVKVKWGEMKWEPRLERKRDSGILYHCQGEHGAFWNVWMQSLECQIQEEDMGDFVALVGTQADITSRETKENFHQYIPVEQKFSAHGAGKPGYVHIPESNEFPNGKWNTVEVIAINDKSIHVVNGKVVMVLHNTRRKVNDDFVPLTKGKIQIQSEAAEVYYKDIQIKAIQKFPDEYADLAKKQVSIK